MPVEFNDEQNPNRVLYGRFTESNQAPKLVTWLLKLHIVKNQDQANKVLIGIALLAFLTSFFFFANLFSTPQTKTAGLEEILQNLPQQK